MHTPSNAPSTKAERDYLVGLRSRHIHKNLVNPRDIAGNMEEEEETLSNVWGQLKRKTPEPVSYFYPSGRES